MALVAYDVSDESNDEEDHISETETIKKDSSGTSINYFDVNPLHSSEIMTVSNKPTLFTDEEDDNIYHNDDDDTDNDEDSVKNTLLSFSNQPLSKPNYHALVVDEASIKNFKSKMLKKLLPTLTPQSTISTTVTNRSTVPKYEKKSGLLSVLQSPVSELDSTSSQGSSTTTLILPAKLLPTAVRNVGTKKEKTKNPNLNNESDDEDIDADFFSLYKVDTVEDLPEPIDIDFSIEMNSISNDLKPERPIQLNKLTGKVIENEIIISKSIDSYHIDGSVNDMETENQVDLDEDAIEKLCGRKRKGQFINEIEVIDIHEDKILAETKKNLVKQLTEEVNYRPSHKKFHGPSSLQKRKHQITYLAYQAKERELELKNQWANNRFTKKQTQSKYGF